MAHSGTSIEVHSHIAAVSWPGECRIYYQGIDGYIYEVAYKEEHKSWHGGARSSRVALARPSSPIAATVWHLSSQNGQPMIGVYFVGNDDQLLERVWTPKSGWKDGPLRDKHYYARPSSRLAVTSWGEGNIVLCFQNRVDSLQIMNGWAERGIWSLGNSLLYGDIATPISMCSLKKGDRRSLWIYCRKGESLQELCWSDFRDDTRDCASITVERRAMEPRDKTSISISATLWEKDARGMRVYLGAKDYLSEMGYISGWIPLAMALDSGGREGEIAAVQRSPGCLCIYSIESGGLMERALEDGLWTQEHIISGTKCCGTTCPGHPQTSVPKPQPSNLAGFLLNPYANPPRPPRPMVVPFPSLARGSAASASPFPMMNLPPLPPMPSEWTSATLDPPVIQSPDWEAEKIESDPEFFYEEDPRFR